MIELLAFVIACVVWSALADRLAALGLPKLPLDFDLEIGGRRVRVPLGSSIALTLIAWTLVRLLR